MSKNLSEKAVTARVSHPAELAVITPYLLGYVPQRSVVILPKVGDRLGMMTRLDVGSPAGMVRDVVATLARIGAVEAVVLSFENEPGEADETAARVCRALVARGIAVIVTGRVHAGEVEFAGVDPCSLSEHLHAAAPFVALGVNPYPSREALAAALAPCHVPEGLEEALGRDEAVTAAECVSAWGKILDPEAGPVEALDVEDLRAAMVGLADPITRDALLAAVWPMLRADEHEALREHVAAVREVVSCARESGVAAKVVMRTRLVALAGATPEGAHRDAVVTVAAHGLYWCGQGTEAGVLLEEAARGGYTLAVLLLSLLTGGVDPRGLAD